MYMRASAPIRVVVVALTAAALMVSCADNEDTTTSRPTPTDATQEPTMPDEPTADDTPTTPPPRTQPPTTSPTPPRRTPPPRVTPLPDPEPSTPTTGEVPAEYLDAVLADAADRAGVTASDVDVIRAQAKTWNDGSLGCPEPGHFYTQALVDGYWVEVMAGGTGYDYRLTGRGDFRLCTSPTLQPPGERTS